MSRHGGGGVNLGQPGSEFHREARGCAGGLAGLLSMGRKQRGGHSGKHLRGVQPVGDVAWEGWGVTG